MSGIKSLSAALVLGAIASSAALAADMLPGPAPQLGSQERLEFGTGWYLRGDISWAREKTPVIFPDGSLGQSTKVQNGYTFGLGGGYKFNSWFRADMTYDYLKEVNVDARSANFTCYDAINPINDINGNVVALHAQENSCYSRQQGRLTRHVLLANGYFDLGSWSGVTPYVGAGVGTSYGRVSANYNWYYAANDNVYNANLFYPNPSPIPEVWLDANGNVIPRPVNNFGVQNRESILNRRNFNLAWALMAGLAYDVSPNAKIDMGYRFLNLGKFGAGSKSARVSEYRIGFRYMVD